MELTGKQMCEAISKELKSKHNFIIKPKDIWEISPTGEIWPVVALYNNLFNRSEDEKVTEELLDKYCGKKFFNLLAED